MPPGVLSTEEILETGRFLLSLQASDGALPWFVDGQWDAWNHTEALMGLTIAGVAIAQSNPEYSQQLLTGARLGLQHLCATQRPDGSWPMSVRGGLVEHDEADTNQCAYPAVGVWHFALATGDDSVLHEYWPMVERSIELVRRAQRADGSIAWAINSRGGLGDHALLTGCSSILQSLWCADRIAQVVGQLRPQWRWAGNRLAATIREHPEVFAPRHRYSMDWFYPVLGGALTGAAAQAHLDQEWDRFVWKGHGVRCVDDHPWVTGGETAELAMSLACLVDEPEFPAEARARTVLRDIALLRALGGGYWTGYVVADQTIWPQEQTGWTAGSILLAADALDRLTLAGNFFHAMTWPQEVA